MTSYRPWSEVGPAHSRRPAHTGRASLAVPAQEQHSPGQQLGSGSSQPGVSAGRPQEGLPFRRCLCLRLKTHRSKCATAVLPKPALWLQPLSLSEELPGVPLLGLGAFTAEA